MEVDPNSGMGCFDNGKENLPDFEANIDKAYGRGGITADAGPDCLIPHPSFLGTEVPLPPPNKILEGAGPPQS